MTSSNGNGFTQKEMLNLILEGQQDINKRIDELHEKGKSKNIKTRVIGLVSCNLSTGGVNQ